MSEIIHAQQTTGNNNDFVYGAVGADELMAQTFTPAATILCSKVELDCGLGGTSPTDNVTVSIQTTSAGYPTGTLADGNATVTVAYSALSASHDWHTFTFPHTFSLTSGTAYAIVMQRSGARSTVNYYVWLINTAGGYTGGIYVSRSSGTWGAGSEGGDSTFKLYASYPSGFLGNFI